MFLSTRDGFLNHCPVKPFVINLDFFVFILFYFFCRVSRQTVILVLLVLIY